ncbi:Methyltransferase domain-containing protein [Clostridium sp. DSM 8431]|uniref:sugar phosphate nucleotidyltransferase n=1 Tax=Clostridium sp. DSM 8431 TaxID=1761781 RepID=UPI0008E3E234|nr:sugar phosphate nucleotidyltransferase [Clostridium sp. DSM 8431]SFU83165.1 Methyltransferase domain-containing protein [Clostridium sp. DSM 8431]
MQVLILAAGEGKRIKSEILEKNKCLIEVNGCSLIENALENIVDSMPVTAITIVVGYAEEFIREKIGKDFRGITINYVKQEKRDGILGALNAALDTIDDDVIMQLGDEYYFEPKYDEGLKIFEESDCVFGICKSSQQQVKETYSIKYSLEGKPIEFCEKPKNPFNNYAGTGMVMLKKSIFKNIRKIYLDGKRDLIDIFIDVVNSNQIISSFECTSFYENVNSKKNYNRLINYIKDKDLSKYFFGVFKDLYTVNNKEVELVKFYQSKFSEVYDCMCHSQDLDENFDEVEENKLVQEEVDFFRSYLALSRGKKVLELACGSGRVTIPFAMHKVKITGVDICKDMLDILSEKVLNKYRRCKRYITLLQDDITNFKLVNEKFNLVIFPATTIRLIDKDLAEFIDYIYDYVEDGGYFIFDNNEIKKRDSQPVIENLYNLSYEKDNKKNVLFFAEQHDFTSMKTRVNFYLNVFDDEVKHYISYTYLNMIDRRMIEDAVSHTRFSEVKFEDYYEDDKSYMYYCVLKK